MVLLGAFIQPKGLGEQRRAHVGHGVAAPISCTFQHTHGILCGEVLILQGVLTAWEKQNHAWESCSSDQARKHFLPAMSGGRKGGGPGEPGMEHHLLPVFVGHWPDCAALEQNPLICTHAMLSGES